MNKIEQSFIALIATLDMLQQNNETLNKHVKEITKQKIKTSWLTRFRLSMK